MFSFTTLRMSHACSVQRLTTSIPRQILIVRLDPWMSRSEGKFLVLPHDHASLAVLTFAYQSLLCKSGHSCSALTFRPVAGRSYPVHGTSAIITGASSFTLDVVRDGGLCCQWWPLLWRNPMQCRCHLDNSDGTHDLQTIDADDNRVGLVR